MQGAGVLPCDNCYPPWMLCISFCKTFPVQCSSLLHADPSTAGREFRESIREGIAVVWGMIKPEALEVSAMDLLVSFPQLALIQSLLAMWLGWTRLCNRRGKHSTSGARAPRAATGPFLMIPTKPGPSLTTSQRGKRLHRLHAFIVGLDFAPRLGRMWEYWGFFQLLQHLWKLHFTVQSEQCDPACFAIPRHWHAWCHP